MKKPERKEKRSWVKRFTDIQAPLIQKNREPGKNQSAGEIEEEIKIFPSQPRN